MSPFPRDDYRTLTRYTPDRGSVAVDLSDNTNLWGTHPEALDRIRAASTDDLSRYPELYADVLRSAVAERFAVPAECVTTGAGSDDVLDSAFRAAAGPDSVVRYAGPTFSMIDPLARMNGMKPEMVPWADALDDPARLLAGGPSVVYVCRPNNPTGELAPEDWVERLLGLAGGRGPLIVLDEAYADFAGETLIRWGAELPNLLVARTASKAYGLAGLRCGFGVANPKTALEVEKSRGPYKVSRLAAHAVASAIRDESGWMADALRACRENRVRLWNELNARRLSPLDSHTNFILFSAPSGSSRADALALRSRNVGVRPFEGGPGVGEGLRVTVGPWPLMVRFLEALDDLLAEQSGVEVG